MHKPKAKDVWEVIVRVHDKVGALVNGNGHCNPEETNNIENDPPPDIKTRHTNVVKEFCKPLQDVAEGQNIQ